jgi:hypothetical protein
VAQLCTAAHLTADHRLRLCGLLTAAAAGAQNVPGYSLCGAPAKMPHLPQDTAAETDEDETIDESESWTAALSSLPARLALSHPAAARRALNSPELRPTNSPVLRPSNSPVLRPSNSPELRPARRSPFQASPKAAGNLLERKRQWDCLLSTDDEPPRRKISHALEEDGENRTEARLLVRQETCKSSIEDAGPESARG